MLVGCLLQSVDKFLGGFDLALDLADFGFLGENDLLDDLAVNDFPAQALRFVKLRKVRQLGEAEFIECLLGVFDGRFFSS